MSLKFEESKVSGPHKQLGRLVGNWKGIAKVWFGPDALADESEVTGTMKLIMDGRFVLHEYSGTFEGKPLSGMAIIGYQIALEKYQCAWIDSFHNGTAIMLSESSNKEMKMLGTYAYVSPEERQDWGWRTEIEIKSDDELVLTAYNISPAGEEDKATQKVYRRVS